ncbi:ArnT family glycosyltransferase [Aquihabitans daechungensis]|uniref:ArnT family glycosyltransferase n=1 Tax=Aquihabitans daechungensis TaxID=1052257 RepID=UPI003BA30420
MTTAGAAAGGAKPRHGRAALVAVGALGVFSAFWRLDRSDWKLDEDAYAQAGWMLVHDGIDPNLGHPPFAKLLFGAAQVLLGRNLFAVRTVSAIGFLVAMAVLFVFGRRVAGWWTGIVAAGLFAVIPRSMVVGGWSVADLRIDRYGLLEAVAGTLVLVGLWAGWRWIASGRMSWAVGAGAAIGLAGASKLNALVVLVPVVVVGVAYVWGRAASPWRPRRWWGAPWWRSCCRSPCSAAGPSTRSSRRSASRPTGRRADTCWCWAPTCTCAARGGRT